MLSSFKGRTLDFTAVPRKKSGYVSKTFKQKVDIIKDKIFNIDTSTSLKNLMKKNSSSRKKVNFENE